MAIIAPNHVGINLRRKKMMDRIKGVVAFVLVIAVTAFVSVKASSKPLPPPPEPILVQWELDKEFNEKRTTLENGLTLSIAKVEDAGVVSWEWTVGGTVGTEEDAVKSALRMGGIK